MMAVTPAMMMWIGLVGVSLDLIGVAVIVSSRCRLRDIDTPHRLGRMRQRAHPEGQDESDARKEVEKASHGHALAATVPTR